MVLRPSRRRAASCGRPEQLLTTGRRRPRMIPRISTNRREPPARVRSVGTGSSKRRVEVPSAERDTVGSSPEDHVDGSQLSPVRRGRGRHGRPRPPHRRNPPGSQRHRPPRTCRGAADARAIGAGCGHGSCVTPPAGLARRRPGCAAPRRRAASLPATRQRPAQQSRRHPERKSGSAGPLDRGPAGPYRQRSCTDTTSPHTPDRRAATWGSAHPRRRLRTAAELAAGLSTWPSQPERVRRGTRHDLLIAYWHVIHDQIDYADLGPATSSMPLASAAPCTRPTGSVRASGRSSASPT